MEPIDFATVFYLPEANMMRAQARSFAVNVPEELVNKIYLVVNDGNIDTNTLKEIASLYGQHQHKLQIISSLELAPNLKPWTHGWWAQQILKLRIVAQANADFVVVLDAKNHFTKRLSYERLITRDGKIVTWALSYVQNFEEHCRGSFAYFGLNAADYIARLPPSITPITLRPVIVRQLIDFIAVRAARSFEEAFLAERNLTEFLAYYAFTIHLGLCLDDVFVFGERQVATLFLDKVKDQNNFDSVMHQALQPSRFMFGVHRSSIPHLTEIQKQRIIEFWKSSAIHISDEESRRWLTLVT